MALPKKGVAYTDYVPLIDTLDPSKFKVDPTIAEGDFQISKDGGAYVNLATLPVVTPFGSRTVKLSLSAAEMNADNINIQALDVAGDEWQEVIIPYNTQDIVNIVDGVWDAPAVNHLIPGTFGNLIEALHKLQGLKFGWPMDVDLDTRTVENIVLRLTDNGRGGTTVTRDNDEEVGPCPSDFNNDFGA